MDLNEVLKKLKNVNPEALSDITRADELFNQNKEEEAIPYYNNAIKLQPDNPYPLIQRGKCYLYLKRYKNALEDLFKSKELQDNSDNNNAIALCYLNMGEYNEAINYFEIALNKLEDHRTIDQNTVLGQKYDSTKAIICNNKAVCHFNIEEFDKAIESTTSGIQSNPNYPNNYRVRGSVYLKIGEVASAKNDLQTAVQLGDAAARNLLNVINTMY